VSGTVTANQGTLAADNVPATDVLSSLDDVVNLTVPQGYRGLVLQFEATTFAGTDVIRFEASVDGGTVWFTVPVVPATGMELPPQTTLTGNQYAFNLRQFMTHVEGYTNFRCRLNPFTAATSVTVRSRFTRESVVTEGQHWVTANAATGDAVAPASGENPLVIAGYDGSVKRRLKTATDGQLVTRIGDGTDEATVLPVRTVPASTEKMLNIADLPTRLPTYQAVTAEVAPPITIGVKELLCFFSPAAVVQDVYIVEIRVGYYVTTAGTTAGRTNVEVFKVTSVGTGGVNVAGADIGGGLGTSAVITNAAANVMQVKTGGGALGAAVLRRQTPLIATSGVGSTWSEVIFSASSVGNGIILRGGSADGINIQVNRVVAHTALVDQWFASIRWVEL
jgi:hypothetical protein